MEIESLIQRNYEAVVNRGKITDKTTDQEFIDKLYEEVYECAHAWAEGNEHELYSELIDVIVVCTNWLHHRGCNIEKLLERNAIKNEKRIQPIK